MCLSEFLLRRGSQRGSGYRNHPLRRYLIDPFCFMRRKPFFSSRRTNSLNFMLSLLQIRQIGLYAQRLGWPTARCRAGSEATARQRAAGPSSFVGELTSRTLRGLGKVPALKNELQVLGLAIRKYLQGIAKAAVNTAVWKDGKFKAAQGQKPLS
jgi:hypothetical protein